jgi:hypothetical protein
MDLSDKGRTLASGFGVLSIPETLESQILSMSTNSDPTDDDLGNHEMYLDDLLVFTAPVVSRPNESAFSVVKRTVPPRTLEEPMTLISREQMLDVIKTVEKAVPALPAGVLEYILKHEAGDRPSYNPNLVGGSGGKYLGLFQFYRVERDSNGTFAWGAARYELARRGLALPAIESGWNDPYYSALAAAGLALANRRIVEKAVGSKAVRTWAPIVFYAAHQQGASYLIKAVRTGKPGPMSGGQSKASVVAIMNDLVKAIS